MKRFFSFLVLAVLFTSCDDGDMQEVSFEFDETAAMSCLSNTGSFFIYKTTDQRALILKLEERNFTKTLTADSLANNGGVIVLPINATNQLIYRVYNDLVSPTTMCPTNGIPASYPVVTEERNASGGNMTIRTTAIRSDEDANGATRITQYLHTITFSDITFTTADGVQRNESLPAITYRTVASNFSYNTLSDIKTCAENNNRLLFRYVGNQAMSLELSEEDAAFLFSPDFSQPKVRYLNATNVLTYRFFSRPDLTPLTDAYFCSPTPPELPSVGYTWTGNNSVDTETGVIEVVTEETDDDVFTHTITLKNVTMARDQQSFKLGNNFIFGEVETTIAP